MSNTPITVGRTVLYCLTMDDADQINRRRTTLESIQQRRKITLEKREVIPTNERGELQAWPDGAQAHIGLIHEFGLELPMLVTAVSDIDVDHVHGQVFLNGNDTLFVMDVAHCDPETGYDYAPGTWRWPPRV